MKKDGNKIIVTLDHVGNGLRTFDTPEVRGFAIDESSWTGEDIFIAWGKPGSIIVTDRVRQLRDDHDLKNVTLTPVEKFVWDPLKQWTPVDYSRDEPPPEPEEVVHHDDSN